MIQAAFFGQKFEFLATALSFGLYETATRYLLGTPLEWSVYVDTTANFYAYLTRFNFIQSELKNMNVISFVLFTSVILLSLYSLHWRIFVEAITQGNESQGNDVRLGMTINDCKAAGFAEGLVCSDCEVSLVWLVTFCPHFFFLKLKRGLFVSYSFFC